VGSSNVLGLLGLLGPLGPRLLLELLGDAAVDASGSAPEPDSTVHPVRRRQAAARAVSGRDDARIQNLRARVAGAHHGIGGP